MTGGTGFIGRQVLAKFVGKVMLYNLSRTPSNIQGVTSIPFNLGKDSISSLKKEISGVDHVIHLGASVDFSDQINENLVNVNTRGTELLVEFAQKCKANFTFASMALIHGKSTGNINIDTPVLLDTAYAKSKLDAEFAIRESLKDHLILRISGVYGLGGPSHFFLNRAISSALTGSREIFKGSTESLRNYISVQSLAEQIAYGIEKNLTGTHLICGHETISFKNMFLTLQNLNHSRLQLELDHSIVPRFDQIIEPSPFFPKTDTFSEFSKKYLAPYLLD